jgi:hypothetical protein
VRGSLRAFGGGEEDGRDLVVIVSSIGHWRMPGSLSSHIGQGARLILPRDWSKPTPAIPVGGNRSASAAE